MKLLLWIPLVLFLAFTIPAQPLKVDEQPQDNHVRSAKVLGVEDGDTCLLTVTLCEKPRVCIDTKIRLKDVHAMEMNKGSQAEQDVARQERAVLLNHLMQAKSVVVQMFNRQTYDRIEGIVWADGVNMNDLLKTYPQGGR